MVKCLKFRTISGDLIKEVPFNYNYPEDWEEIMGAGEDWSFIKIPEGYTLDWIDYTPGTKTVTYYLLEGVIKWPKQL